MGYLARIIDNKIEEVIYNEYYNGNSIDYVKMCLKNINIPYDDVRVMTDDEIKNYLEINDIN